MPPGGYGLAEIHIPAYTTLSLAKPLLAEFSSYDGGLGVKDHHYADLRMNKHVKLNIYQETRWN